MIHVWSSRITWLAGVLLVAAAGRAQALYGVSFQRWDNDIRWTILSEKWSWPAFAAGSWASGLAMIVVPGVCFYLLLGAAHLRRLRVLRWVLELPVAAFAGVGLLLWLPVFVEGFRLNGEIVSEGLLPFYGFALCYCAVWVGRIGNDWEYPVTR